MRKHETCANYCQDLANIGRNLANMRPKCRYARFAPKKDVFFGPLHPAPLVVTTAPNIAQAVRAPRADLRPSPQVTFMHAKCEQRSTKNTK